MSGLQQYKHQLSFGNKNSAYLLAEFTIMENLKHVLVIEPFYSGSRRQFLDILSENFGEHLQIYTLPGKKWHWRARTSALYFP